MTLEKHASGRRLGVAILVTVALGCAGRGGPPGSTATYTIEDRLEVVEAEPEPPSFAQEVALGDQLRDNGNTTEAVFHYLRGLQLDHDSPIPRQRIGFLQLARDVERGQRIFEDLARREPGMASAHLGVGLALVARGRLEEASRALERALEVDSENDVALIALGLIADEREDFRTARSYYVSALRVAPERYEVHNNLGVSYLLSGDYERAAEAFRDAVHVDPHDPAVHNNLGVALARMGLYEEALESFRLTSTEADALNNVGLVCLVSEEYARAVGYFVDSLLLGPSDRDRVLSNLTAAEVGQVRLRAARP